MLTIEAKPGVEAPKLPWERDIWKCLLYGNSGVGKTNFLADTILNKGMHPAKVFMFDLIGNDVPYKKLGTYGPSERMEDGGLFCLVKDKQGNLLVEIEYFFDLRPAQLATQKNPCALERFQGSLGAHLDEDWKGYKFIILDSYDGYFNAALMAQQHKFNTQSKAGNKANSMQWYGEAKLNTVSDILCSLVWHPTVHVCLVAHVDRSRTTLQERQVWGINAPGTLSSDIPSMFPEVYYMYTNEKGERLLTTENDGQYMAKSHIGASSPCVADWHSLWGVK